MFSDLQGSSLYSLSNYNLTKRAFSPNWVNSHDEAREIRFHLKCFNPRELRSNALRIGEYSKHVTAQYFIDVLV